jgi:GTPase SAR1 family protein
LFIPLLQFKALNCYKFCWKRLWIWLVKSRKFFNTSYLTVCWWISLLNNTIFVRNRIPLVIVGNKTDLHRERVVSTEEGKRLADTWKASFYEVSARSHEVCVLNSIEFLNCNRLRNFVFISLSHLVCVRNF